MACKFDGPGKYKSLSVTTTAVELKVDATIARGRKAVSIMPIDGVIYWGLDSSVTSSNGTKIYKNQWIVIPFAQLQPVWLIAAAGTVDVRIAELA